MVSTWNIEVQRDSEGCYTPTASNQVAASDCSIGTASGSQGDFALYTAALSSGGSIVPEGAGPSGTAWSCRFVGDKVQSCGTPARVDEPKALPLLFAAVLAAWISVARRAATSRSRLLAQQCSRVRRV